MRITPLVRFINIDGSERVSPLVNVLGMSMDRRDAGNPRDMLTDLIGIGPGPCKRHVYTFSIDYQGAERIVPGSNLALLPDCLTGQALHEIQSGQATLLLDDSTEACRFSPKFGVALIDMLKGKGIPLRSLFVVSQNVAFLRHLKSWLATNGIGDIECAYYSYFLAAIAQKAQARFAALQAWHAHVSAAWTRVFGDDDGGVEKKFICMNNMPKAHRLGVLLNLQSTGLIREGFVSFAGGDVIKTAYPQVKDLLYAASCVLDVHGPRGGEIRKLVAGIHAGPGYAIDRDVPGVTRSGDITNDLNVEFFGRSLFTIHCETEFTNGLCSRITEKTFKPLVNFHPFVLFGDPGSLALVRALGFKTFAPVIDERYDEESDPYKRFDMAWAEAARLAAMPRDALRGVIRQLWPVLRYNAQYALDGLRDHLLFTHGFPIIERIIAKF